MRILLVLLTLLFAYPAQAQLPLTGAGKGAPSASCSGTEAVAFLARTSGLDASHTSNYCTLINGLVADGVWAKLDVLVIFATQDATTARLNLIQNSANPTLVSTPTFTADRGYAGNGTTTYLNSQFNPSTFGGQFTQNSASLAVWDRTIGAAAGLFAQMGATDGSTNTDFFIRLTGDLADFRMNAAIGATYPTNTTTDGFFVGNRSSSTAVQQYRNGAAMTAIGAVTSGAPPNLNFFVCGRNNSAAFDRGTTDQIAAYAIGGSLSSTDVTNFYNRMQTYMTAVGA